MDLETARQQTAEVFQSLGHWTPDYITPELLSAYEEEAEEPADDDGQAKEDDEEVPLGRSGVRAIFYYGNRPVFVRDTSRPGYVGKLFFSNGSVNRPNDPCGRRFRRVVWCRSSPYGDPYRNCGSFWGFRFTIS